MSAAVLNLSFDLNAEPTVKLTAQIIKGAIKLNADAILFELDTELHLKVHEEVMALSEALEKKSLTKDEVFFRLGRLPNACGVIYTIGGKREQMTPLSGELFGNFVNILLLATGIPPWTKGKISAPLETIKPASEWLLESDNVTRRIQLQRIRAK